MSAKSKSPATYAAAKVAIGGLMRCCTATIADFVEAHGHEPFAPIALLDCKHEKPGNGNITLDAAGIWRWTGPKAAS